MANRGTPSASGRDRVGLAALVAALAIAAGAVGLGDGAAAAASRVAASDARDTRGPLDLVRVRIEQKTRRIVLEIRSTGTWRLGELGARPSFDPRRPESYLCAELLQGSRWVRGCVGGSQRDPRLVMTKMTPDGPRKRTPVEAARVTRPDARSVRVSARYRALGLGVGRYRWRAMSAWADGVCLAPGGARALEPCRDYVPDQGRGRARVVRPRIVGCTRDERRVVFNGPRSRRRVALTFDDGPSGYTRRILDILRRYRAKATFFVVGQETGGRGAIMRKALRRGNELGNHSWRHEFYPSGASIVGTSRRIRAATGFTPCTFRPPYGVIHSSVTSLAWRRGMSTVIWDIDTNDWRNPGSGSIYTAATAAGPGSIVLMHDGGGSRSQTVAALPAIIRNLKGRGYRLVTMTKLLRERYIWRP